VLDLEGPHGRHRITYNDPRRFGYMTLAPRDGLEAHPLFAGLGIEPLGNALDGGLLATLFKGRKAPVKAALLDQRLIAGLGNIYVCEALWQAKISPVRAAGSLSKANATALAGAIRDVLARAIEAGGSTLRDHRLADGSLGYFQHSFRVYDREGEPCARSTCKGVVTRLVQSGRSTFHCPVCQR
jgi:formamidopyrimidine-DNA glycosylase